MRAPCCSEPKIILLDEPTEGIQPNIVEQIEQVLIDLNRKHGNTIVLVEQNVAFAAARSNHFVIVDRGSVAVGGPIDQLTDRDHPPASGRARASEHPANHDRRPQEEYDSR